MMSLGDVEEMCTLDAHLQPFVHLPVDLFYPFPSSCTESRHGPLISSFSSLTCILV